MAIAVVVMPTTVVREEATGNDNDMAQNEIQEAAIEELQNKKMAIRESDRQAVGRTSEEEESQ